MTLTALLFVVMAGSFIGGGLSYKYGVHRDVLFFYYDQPPETQPEDPKRPVLVPFSGLPGDRVSPVFRLAYEGEAVVSPSVFDLDGDGRADVSGHRTETDGSFEAISLDELDLPKYRLVFYADFDSDSSVDALIISKISYQEQVTNKDNRPQLYFGRDGRFERSEAFDDLQVVCQAEQPVLADFNNDGHVDIFLPCYTHVSSDAHNYLLINDGNGVFEDRADQAGVAMPGVPANYRVEGAQAADISGDGWLDLYVGSRLFVNNRNLTFSNLREDKGIFHPLFDEGVKFEDVNNDGRLDLVVYATESGPKVFIGDKAGTFLEHGGAAPRGIGYSFFGMNLYDLNNDGFEDMVLGKDEGHDTHVLIGRDGSFSLAGETGLVDYHDLKSNSPSFGDFNGDGRIDFARRVMDTKYAGDKWLVQVYLNETPTSNGSFTVELLGKNGERNQQGRRVSVRPVSRSDFCHDPNRRRWVGIPEPESIHNTGGNAVQRRTPRRSPLC
ncbi:MAG: VCBS repeat-containing protein [Chloroflexi bacterium]|nr:VCBS repeat-containing protein [Chloroflexota bacterium]